MKKRFTILSLMVLLASSLVAQSNYIPFKTDSVVWVDDTSSAFTFNYNHYRPVGDTLINNKIYAILTEIRSSINSPVPTFSNEDTIGFYRNDSINKKVYFLPIDSINEELFYDFDLATGDTLDETYFMRIKGFGQNLKFVVNSVGDTTFADSVRRKIFRYSCIGGICPNRILVEGIGTLTGFTSSFEGSGLSRNERLSCYKEAGNLVYSQGGCPSLPVSLNKEEIGDLSFTIYPNPSEGEFNLRFEKKVEQPEQLQITNINGQAVNFEMFEKTNDEIEIRLDVPAGVYLIRLGKLSKKVIVW